VPCFACSRGRGVAARVLESFFSMGDPCDFCASCASLHGDPGYATGVCAPNLHLLPPSVCLSLAAHRRPLPAALSLLLGGLGDCCCSCVSTARLHPLSVDIETMRCPASTPLSLCVGGPRLQPAVLPAADGVRVRRAGFVLSMRQSVAVQSL
jgi:hypothetical protein